MKAQSFLAVLTIWQLVNPSSGCPEECACLTLPQGTRVHCRYQQLKALPDSFPEDTFEIDFGHNILPELTSRTFPTLPNLQRLLLDFCQIKAVQDFAFSRLTSLQYLRLSDNKITSISDYAFDGLSDIDELHLDLNELEEIPQRAFNGMRLETLSLKGNRLTALDKDVFQGAHITNLILDENRLQSVSKDSMEPLSGSLKSLHLSRNKEPLTLQEEALANFDLSELTVTFAGMKSSSFLCNVKAGSVDISGNPFQTLDFRDCGGLTYTTELHLRNLSIQYLGDSWMSALTKVTMLDLSHNKIDWVSGDNFKDTPNLISLDLSNNRLEYFEDDFGQYLTELEVLKMSNNEIFEVSVTPFKQMTKLKQLSLDHNKIQVFPEDMLPLFNGLEVLELAGNYLHCNCETKWFREWLEVTTLATGADDCASPLMGSIWQFEPKDFKCEDPVITRPQTSLNINEKDDAFLSCSATGDPAPLIEWGSPHGYGVKVSPPTNKTRHLTYAMWSLNYMSVGETGWYSCTATNVNGKVTQYFYIHVVPDGGTTIDVASLVHPDSLLPTEPLTHPATSDMQPTKEPTEEETTEPMTQLIPVSTLPSSSTSKPDEHPATISLSTSTAHQSSKQMITSESDTVSPIPTTTLARTLKPHHRTDDIGGDGISTFTILVVIGCSVGIPLVAIVTSTIVHLTIKHRKSKSYKVPALSDKNSNNNTPALLKDSRIEEV